MNVNAKPTLPRRAFIVASMANSAALLSATVVSPSTLFAATPSQALTGPASVPNNRSLAALMLEYAAGAVVQTGRVQIQIASLVDNGNSVPIDVSITSPMTATDHVVSIAIFNEKNPEHQVAEFILSPQSGRARVATRIRLAMTQKIIALAKMQDGTCWMESVDVLVTLAACIEE